MSPVRFLSPFPGLRQRAGGLLVLAALLAPAACSDSPTPPGTLRFGQIGEVRVQIAVPLGATGQGELQQTLTWNSAGPWQITESISYNGLVGDVSTVASTTNPEVLSGIYAQWITQVHEVQSLRLFIDALDPTLEPECREPRSRVTLLIRDATRNEEIRWIRCANGSLSTMTPVGAGPDVSAGRVLAAAQLVREYTLGDGFLSVYHGSVPFGTLGRGDDSPAPLAGPRVLREQGEWVTFWTKHTGSVGIPPTVDFEKEMVLISAVGTRQEAGDSVEIRRVLPVDQATYVEHVLRVPGDFCSPAAHRHVPYHIVMVPRVPDPVIFQDAKVERVPCGR